MTTDSATTVENIPFFQGVWDYIVKLVEDIVAYLPTLVVDLLICVLIWLAARFLITRITNYTTRILKEAKVKKANSIGDIRRAKSIATLIRSSSRYLIYFVAILAMLSVLGLGDTTALLASAGIGSIAIGFGAQSLVKDVIAGIFMVFENQYSVGDYVKIKADGGEVDGTVEAIAMRVTYIRNYYGQQFIIPNGSIHMVVNSTRGDFLALVEVPVSYEENTRRVCDIALEAAKMCAKQMPEHALSEPVMVGIVALNESNMTIRITCECVALKQWEFERKMRLAIKEAFDENGIKMPYQKVDIVNEHKGSENSKT